MIGQQIYLNIFEEGISITGLSFYQEVDSWFESLNPLSKLIFVGIMIIIPFLSRNLYLLSIYLLVVIILTLSAKILKSYILILSKMILPFLALLFAMQSVLYPEGQIVLFSIGFISVKKEGVFFASLIGLRLLIAVGSMLLFFMTTHPKNLITSLEQKGMSSKIGFVILSTMQIIPQMKRQSQKILEAQKARGVEVEGNILVRMKAYLPVLAPLILSSISQLEERALALEARAFSAPVKNTTMMQFSLTKADKIFRYMLYLLTLIVLVSKVVKIWL